MRRPPRPLVLLLSLPFLGACFAPQSAPLPTPAEREEVEDIRGVIVGNPDDGGERVEFEEVYSVEWGDDDVSIYGWMAPEDAPAGAVTRSFRYDDLSAILTNQLDANRTSFLVAGIILSGIAAVVFFFTERTGGAGTVIIGG